LGKLRDRRVIIEQPGDRIDEKKTRKTQAAFFVSDTFINKSSGVRKTPTAKTASASAISNVFFGLKGFRGDPRGETEKDQSHHDEQKQMQHAAPVKVSLKELSDLQQEGEIIHKL
jgi:hypothetical protein